jgi:hypothetical protein
MRLWAALIRLRKCSTASFNENDKTLLEQFGGN